LNDGEFQRGSGKREDPIRDGGREKERDVPPGEPLGTMNAWVRFISRIYPGGIPSFVFRTEPRTKNRTTKSNQNPQKTKSTRSALPLPPAAHLSFMKRNTKKTHGTAYVYPHVEVG
jgi:hypothetical protein